MPKKKEKDKKGIMNTGTVIGVSVGAAILVFLVTIFFKKRGDTPGRHNKRSMVYRESRDSAEEKLSAKSRPSGYTPPPFPRA